MSKQKRNIRPWVVMCCIGLISAACLGSSMVLMGSFLAPLSQALHTPISTLSYYYTVLVLAMAVMTPNVPKILAKVNNKLLFAIASLAVAVSLFLMPHFTAVWMFFVIAIIIGVAISFMSFTPVGILIDNWFSDQAGFAIGLCWAITSVFQGIMSPVLSVLITKYGWQQSMTILAIIVAVLSIPCALFGINFTPELEGRKPYGYKEDATDDTEETSVKPVSNHELFKSVTFWLLLAIVILLQFPAVMNQMFPTYAASAGFSGEVGGFMVTAAMVFDIFLNPLVGSTCDKYGAEKASLFWLAVSVVSYILLILATNMHSANLAIFSAGINDIFYVYLGTGITTIATAALGKRAFAKGFSYVNSIAFLIGAFAMPLNNLIAEKFGGFNAVYVFFAVIAILIMVLVAIIAKKHFETES
ncbi:MFS transporter [Lactobacillus sp. ESL0731]|uniref:MFS transporter n=1 Tax=unclassified Lactobacillus TaxID=2620435 RepID=UPI0023F662E6|nr:MULTISPECIES: MFS transporter [unclassified Lactobacillus]WEV51380.1 MFS transporter [Lactobacillus sp. ESL0700]WEV62510.1 MFS transporter [Lactobacillus sp. ESL0731]